MTAQTDIDGATVEVVQSYLTAAANEVFKHAKRVGYGDHDVSAVYLRARF